MLWTKWVAALLLAASTQVFAAETFSPEIGVDSGRPTIALRVNQSTGAVDVHYRGSWRPAREINNMVDVNAVETGQTDTFFWNFFFGSYRNYWSYYPRHYYYYTPSYRLYYGYNGYYPYYWYNRNYYSYYSYRW